MGAAIRILGTAAAGMLLVGVHHGLRVYLLGSSQRYVLHLRSDMLAMGDSLRRHIGRSGYPARVKTDGEPSGPPDRLVAEVVSPPVDSREEQSTVMAFFDPARFCDVVLRAFPPAMLEQRLRELGSGGSARL
jgi:hypothetical protein